MGLNHLAKPMGGQRPCIEFCSSGTKWFGPGTLAMGWWYRSGTTLNSLAVPLLNVWLGANSTNVPPSWRSPESLGPGPGPHTPYSHHRFSSLKEAVIFICTLEKLPFPSVQGCHISTRLPLSSFSRIRKKKKSGVLSSLCSPEGPSIIDWIVLRPPSLVCCIFLILDALVLRQRNISYISFIPASPLLFIFDKILFLSFSAFRRVT